MRGCPEVEFVRIQRPVLGFPGGSVVKNLPAMQETWVQSLGQEDPLEKGMAPHFSILPGEFHGQGSLAGYSPWGHEELDTTKRLTCIRTRDQWRGD